MFKFVWKTSLEPRKDTFIFAYVQCVALGDVGQVFSSSGHTLLLRFLMCHKNAAHFFRSCCNAGSGH